MAQRKTLPQGSQPPMGRALAEVKSSYTPKTFHDRNLMGVSPLKEQFEPTEASMVRAHNKMAGGCD